MSHEKWLQGFGNANEDLAEHMAGSMEKPWWPVIPPKD